MQTKNERGARGLWQGTAIWNGDAAGSRRRGLGLVLAVVLAGGGAAGCESDRASVVEPKTPAASTAATTATGSVVFNGTSKQQVITAWEAAAEAGQGTPSYPLYRDKVLTLATGDLGITRLRVTVRSGMENPKDYFQLLKSGQITQSMWKCLRYTVVNDDANASHINPAGFHFSELDSTIEQLVLPMRSKMTALGKRLIINMNYTAFTGSCGNAAAAHQNPQEYAEFALAVFQHLQSKYALVPDMWEMILEPDNGTPFSGSGSLIGKALVATNARLTAAGFHPTYIASSDLQASTAISYYDQLKTVAGAAALVSEISYHRYGTPPTTTQLNAIAQRAQANGGKSAMLEKIGADYNTLIADLLQARVSAWQQFTIAYPTTDNGAQYYVINTSNPSAPTVTMGSRTRYLRQFFHYVLPGATRVGASTSQAGITATVGFLNPNGKAVLVARTSGASTFTVQGLPAGTYGLRYTTAGATDAAAGADQTILAGQLVKGSMPAAGLITIFGR